MTAQQTGIDHDDPDLRRRRPGADRAGRRRRRPTGPTGRRRPRRCPTARPRRLHPAGPTAPGAAPPPPTPTGTRRRSPTTTASTASLVNDSTSDTSTPAGTATTASYLLTAGREARTLLPGTAPSGRSPEHPPLRSTPAPASATTSATGTPRSPGWSTTPATSPRTYAYTDYGTPARADGRPVNLGAFDGGRTNPYTYLGAAPRGPSTEASTGLLAFADRTYDPSQGRFTSPDPVDAHNLYQGFNTNPITYLDLSGQISTVDIVLEACSPS